MEGVFSMDGRIRFGSGTRQSIDTQSREDGGTKAQWIELVSSGYDVKEMFVFTIHVKHFYPDADICTPMEADMAQV